MTPQELRDHALVSDQLDAALADVAMLRDENYFLRAAQKACEDCDAPTRAEIEKLRAERDLLADEVKRCWKLEDAYYERDHRASGWPWTEVQVQENIKEHRESVSPARVRDILAARRKEGK